MKHLRKFENFDLGHRFSEEEDEMQIQKLGHSEEEEECKPCASEEEEELKDEKNWNDEEELRLEKVISFRQFEAKKAKPDFLDLDKDGNKKESMKKASKDAKEGKEDKKEDKGGKGLTAAQKKLPEGLRKAIEARKKK